MQTPRELVRNALTFNHPERLPRGLWMLPWVDLHLPELKQELEARWPGDFGGAGNPYRPSARAKGDAYAVGKSTDDWGCEFLNLQAGVIGEVKEPLVADLAAWERLVRPPVETLPENPAAARELVNRNCAATDKFVTAGCCPRPWERYQFLRGTENALMDIMEPDANVRGILRRIHEFHLRELEFWLTTDVDAMMFMDDWGSQQQLLIPPAAWHELFKPLYADYCALARAHGKFSFMHSDGCITEIYDALVEVGVDALNSQVFCMDMAELAKKAKGKLTFWGEIDRQHVLPSPDPTVGRQAVRDYARHFFDPAGGVIVQFEVSPGSNPATVLAVMEEWDAIQREAGLRP
ncbi:MAG: uroporphyrinogen decarboxylase family protein [Lentisphaeria bacterium]|jgi:hypothetical protein